MKRLLTLVVLMLGVSTSAYAQDFGNTIIDFFAGGGSANPATEASLTSTLSFYLNLIALAMMAWLGVLAGSSFIIQTANKGTLGGQVISSFWMPLRICTATILLIPGTNGYSALQYGVLTNAKMGNDVGNVVMAGGLNYIYANGVYRPPMFEDGSALIMAWTAAEVCRQYVNSYTESETIVPTIRTRSTDGYYVTEMGYDWNETPNSAVGANPRTNYCGNISFRMDNNITAASVGDSIFTYNGLASQNLTDQSDPLYASPARIAPFFEGILRETQENVSAIAAMVLHDEGALRNLQSGGSSYQPAFESARAQTPQRLNDAKGLFVSAVGAYNEKIRTTVASTVEDVIREENDNQSWKDQIISAGWPFLGTVFWQVQMSQMQINGVAKLFAATYSPPMADSSFASDTRYAEIAARVEALSKKYAETKNTSALLTSANYHSLSAIADSGAEGSGMMDKVKSWLFQAAAIPYKVMINRNDDDLIVNMQYFGSVAGGTAEYLFWAKTLSKASVKGATAAGKDLVGGLKSSAEKIPVVGGILGGFLSPVSAFSKGVSAFAESIVDDISGMLNMVCFYLIIVGFTLAIVLPTIPLIHWFMGVISWMLFFIECLLVSPMWLAAHGTAEKEGWGSEHTRQGYMLMIGLFLAPTLRVVGFLAIFLALKPIGALANALIDYVHGVIISGVISPFMILGCMALVSIFCYSSMTRIFSLPSELFERGLRWINGGQEVTGDASSEKESRHNVAAFSSKSEHAGIHGVKPGGGFKDPKDPGNTKPV